MNMPSTRWFNETCRCPTSTLDPNPNANTDADTDAVIVAKGKAQQEPSQTKTGRQASMNYGPQIHIQQRQAKGWRQASIARDPSYP